MNKEDIKSQDTEELVNWYKGLVFANYILDWVSTSELRTIPLLENELQSRNFPAEKLQSWYDDTKKEYKKYEF